MTQLAIDRMAEMHHEACDGLLKDMEYMQEASLEYVEAKLQGKTIVWDGEFEAVKDLIPQILNQEYISLEFVKEQLDAVIECAVQGCHEPVMNPSRMEQLRALSGDEMKEMVKDWAKDIKQSK